MDIKYMWKNGKEPDFINELGIKWWIQELPEKYDFLEKQKVQWWFAEGKDFWTHIIIQNKKILFENTSVEAVGIFLDILQMKSEVK